MRSHAHDNQLLAEIIIIYSAKKVNRKTSRIFKLNLDLKPSNYIHPPMLLCPAEERAAAVVERVERRAAGHGLVGAVCVCVKKGVI